MKFHFATSADIRFGRGMSKEAAATIASFSDRILLIHGRSPERAAWLKHQLIAHGRTVETAACLEEPDIEAVAATVEKARKYEPGVVVAIGGGAAIDLGKAVSALATVQGPTLAYLDVVGDGRALDAPPLPFVALPTTAGTGAEVTKNAVIGVPEAGRKVSLRDPRMIPDVAIVDPELTDNTPASVTFASGLDAVTQVIEPYLSPNASPFTDALCEDAIPRGLGALIRLAKIEDPKARDDMALTSLFGGIALANAGLGGVHGLAGVIGGRIGAPHGEICASLLPHVLRYNAQRIPDQTRTFEKMQNIRTWIGVAIGVAPENALTALAAETHRFGIRTLGALGMSQSEIDDVSKAATAASSSRTNPIRLESTDLSAILKNCFADQ